MLCREIMAIIECTYPKCAALEWDNVGLLVGRKEKEVKKIYIALDATDEVIDEAIKFHADMLITLCHGLPPLLVGCPGRAYFMYLVCCGSWIT